MGLGLSVATNSSFQRYQDFDPTAHCLLFDHKGVLEDKKQRRSERRRVYY